MWILAAVPNVQQVAEAARVVQQTADGMNGPTWVGSIVGGLVLVFVAARPLISKLRLGSAMDGAQIDAIDRLSKLLDEERKARHQAEERADKFAQERNDAISKVGRLEGEVAALRTEVENLRKMLLPKSPSV